MSGAVAGRPDHQHLGEQRGDQLPGVVRLGAAARPAAARAGDVALQARRGDGSLYSGCSAARCPDTVPPASPIRPVTLVDVSSATSSLVTTRAPLCRPAARRPARAPRPRRRRRRCPAGLCSCWVRSSSARLSCSSAVTWFLMSSRIGWLSAVVPMTIPERDGQEDGDQRDQVVAEVDHEKRFSSQNTKLFHWSSSRSRYTRPAAETRERRADGDEGGQHQRRPARRSRCGCGRAGSRPWRRRACRRGAAG